MNVNFARLNHILIPTTKAGRDRFRGSLVGRLIRPLGAVYGAFSEEGRVLAVATVGIGAFGLDVQSTVVYLLWSALAGLLLASLALTRLHRLDGVRLAVDAPRRVTLGDAITFSIVARNDGPRDRDAVRLHGPFLPWDGVWTGPSPEVARLPAGATERADLVARFSSRGEHHLDGSAGCYLGC